MIPVDVVDSPPRRKVSSPSSAVVVDETAVLRDIDCCDCFLAGDVAAFVVAVVVFVYLIVFASIVVVI